MKKFTKLLPILAMALGTLVGCGGTPADDTHVYTASITNKDVLTSQWYTDGGNRTLVPSITVDGETANATQEMINGNLSVTSSNTDVLTNSGFVLTPVAAGNTTVTVSFHDAVDTVDITITKTPSLRIATSLTEEGEYFLGMTVKSGATLYATGAMSSYYLEAKEGIAQATSAKVLIDSTAEDAYRYIIKLASTDDAAVDGYLTIGSYSDYKAADKSGHTNIGFVEKATASYPYETALFKLNDDLSLSTKITSTADSSTTEYWMGTYGTYQTFSYRELGTIEYKAFLFEYGEKVAVESVTVSPATATLDLDNYETSLQLSATLAPLGAYETITWSSDNAEVATVDSASGLVTASKAGTAHITATAGDTGVTGQCTLTVVGELNTHGLTEDDPLTVDEAVVIADAVASDNTPTPVVYYVKGVITSIAAAYSSSFGNISLWLAGAENAQAFEVFRLKVTEEEAATLVVGAEIVFHAHLTKYKGTMETVGNDADAGLDSVDVSTVRILTLNKSTLDVVIGTPETLTVTLYPTAAVTGNEVINWAVTSGDTFASVTNGEVSGLAEGEAVVTASLGTLSASCTVTVSAVVDNHGKSLEDPLNVAEAIALCQEQGSTISDEVRYVTGIVSSVSFNSTYSSYTLKIHDSGSTDLFTVYSGTKDASVLEPMVNDTIIAYGNYMNHNSGGPELTGTSSVAYPTIASVTAGDSTLTVVENESVVTGIAAGTVANHTECSFTVVANSGYQVDSVKVGNTVLTASEGTYSFVMSGDMTVTVSTSVEGSVVPEDIEMNLIKCGTTTGYASSSDVDFDGITWNIPGNQTLNYGLKIGGKLDAATDRVLYSKTAIADDVTSFTVTHGTKDSQITVNSVTLYVYSTAADAASGSSDNLVSTVSGTFVDGGDTTFNRPSDVSWAGRYFRLVYNLSASSTSKNYGAVLTKITISF